MKRVLACLLSLALMALPCVQAYGAGAGLESSRETAESSAPETKGTESVPPETDETEETETESASPETGESGTETVSPETGEAETEGLPSEMREPESEAALDGGEQRAVPYDPKESGQVRVDMEDVLGFPLAALRVPAWREVPSPPEDELYREYAPPALERMTLRLIPYFAWANRSVGEMRVWLRV